MEPRRLLLIDQDLDFYGSLSQSLSPYGFEIHQAVEADDPLAEVKSLRPELIIIAVDEPDKVGYALCNKAKKGIAKQIPVILTTATVPPAGFEKHRKLKVHADGYIDKRATSAEQIMSVVDQLVGLGEAESAVDDDLGIEVEELEMDDLDMAEFDAVEHEDESVALEPPDEFAPEEFVEESTAVAPPLAFLEASFGAEVDGPGNMFGSDEDSDQVFDTSDIDDAGLAKNASAHEEITAVTSSDEVSRRELAEGSVDEVADEPLMLDRDEEITHIPDELEVQRARQDASAEDAESNLGAFVQEENRVEVVGDADLDLGLEAVADAAASEREATPPTSNQDVAVLRAEIDRLKSELAAAQSQGGGKFSKEREFLNLREKINKKEKESLDLQDQLYGKDREVLAGKEKIRELERSYSDLDEKMLVVEQSLLAANEKSAELEGQLAMSRSQQEQERQEHEKRIEALTQRHAQELGKAKTEHEAARNMAIESLEEEHASRLQELESEHNAAIAEATATLERERAAAAQTKVDFEGKIAALDTDMSDLATAHAAALEALEKDSLEKLQALEDQHAGQVSRLKREFHERTEKTEAEHSQAIATLRTDHEQALEDARQAHEKALAAARREHADELSKTLAEAEARRQADLATANEEREAAEDQLQAKHEADRSAVEQEHAEAIAVLAGEKDKLRDTLTGARADIADLQAKLSKAEADIEARNQQIESHLQTIAQRDDRIGNLKDEVSELETQNAGYQEQVLKAYQKIKSDEATVARAKKAMAIAITLLDETSSEDDDDSASAT